MQPTNLRLNFTVFMGNLRHLAAKLILAAAIISGAIACTKVDYTTVGGDLIPVVDNINTFDTVLDVNTYSYIPEDTTRLFAADGRPVGVINDPVFGKTTSRVFFEMKPTSFPFLMLPKDSLEAIDSAVLVLQFSGYYGDSLQPVNLKLYEAAQKMNRDTMSLPFYTIKNDLAINRSSLIGEKTMSGVQFRDSMVLKRGNITFATVANQLRIPISGEWVQRFFAQDSSANGAYRSDSLYKEFFKGFVLEADGGSNNTLLYFNLASNNSALTFFYRQKRGNAIDTVSKSFDLTGLSAHASQIETDRAGAELLSHIGPDSSTDRVYIQAVPQVDASIKIPGIATLTNRVIHRAELRITELNPTTQSIYRTPNVLYLDVVDTSGHYRGIPYDLSPYRGYYCFPSSSGILYSYFGGAPKLENVDGEMLNVYRFNISRYVQGVITRNERPYDFRLSAPYMVYYDQCGSADASLLPGYYPMRDSYGSAANLPGNGRVVLAGGDHQHPQKRMQLHIIYSQVK